MNPQQYILNRFVEISREFYSQATPRYKSKGIFLIGPSDACLKKLVDSFPIQSEEMELNIRSIILFSHFSLAFLNGEKEREIGNVSVVDRLYRIAPGQTQIELYYKNRLQLILNAADRSSTFHYCALPTLNDNSVTAMLQYFKYVSLLQ